MSVEVFVQICQKFNWKVYDCKSSQVCKYVSILAKTMRYPSVINYYQTVIIYCNVNGKVVTNWSDPLLAQTVKGMKKTRVSSRRC